jgi:hypothetical protein
MSDWLWTELHDYFDTDDGSLPEVRVDFADKQAVIRAFAELRARGKDVTHRGSTFWSVTDAKDCPLDSVPNAAALVVSGEAQPFHFVLRDIEMSGVRLPDLGVWIFDDQIAINYRMGEEWGSTTLRALLGLLLAISHLDPKSSVTLDPKALPDVAERFRTCWSRFLAERGS